MSNNHDSGAASSDAKKLVKDRVYKIIVSQLGMKEDQISPESHFVDDLKADSLDQVEMVMLFEEEFDVEIPDDVAEKMVTVGHVLKYIESHV